MAKNNKSKQPERTPQENEQIQDILAQYNQIATNLAKSRNEEQIEDALSSIFEMSEAAQIGLLKTLAKEHSIPAADIALAVNTYASIKEVRKEARRSLIQLEGSNTYPEWAMPSVISLSDIIGIDDAFNEFEDDEDEDDEVLDGENVIERFLRYWGQRDFELAYDLLTTNSPLKEGLSREEWTARRQTWATEVELNSDSLKIDVGYTLAVEDLADDLEDEEEELDAFWSVEMKDVPSSSSIPELPTATITLQATGRHWFWANYTFLMEGDALRIHNMRDMGAEVLQLSSEEVEERLQEITKELQVMSEALAEDKRDSDESDVDEVQDEVEDEIDESDDDDESEEEDEDEFELDLDEVRWFTRQSLHYCDALIAHPPTEDDVYEGTAQQAVLIDDMERVAAYYTIGAERLPEARGEMLRSLGLAYTQLVADDDDAHEFEEELEEEENTVSEAFVSRYFPLAEKALREALATDNDFTTYILLAELLFRQNNRLAEAKTLFDQAQEVAKSPQDKAAIEIGRARIARLENRPEEALVYFQNAIDAESDLPGIWYHMGELQLSLSQKDAAEESFLKSIEVEPTVVEAYADLATLYVEQGSEEAAMHVLEQGVAANPLAADIKAALAMLYLGAGDVDKAEELIEEAEELDPELELVNIIRQIIDMQKLQMQQQQRSASSKPNKSKKRR